MSGQGEPEGGVPRVGVGQEPGPWEQPAKDDSDHPTHDFGPRPLASHLEGETPTGSRPYPEAAAVPNYVDPSTGQQPAVSGPYQVPQGSGPHYVDQTPSGQQIGRAHV